MINNRLLDYIKQQLSLKVGREVITNNLKGAGWTEADINEVFTSIAPVSAPTSAPVSPIASSVMSNVAPIQTAQPGFLTTSQVTMGQPLNSPQSVHKSKKIFSIILILVLLGLAGGVAAYTYYSDVFVNLPSLLSKAIDNAKVVKSGNYDSMISLDFSQVKNITGNSNQFLPGFVAFDKFTITAKGSNDTSDTKNIKGSMLLSVDAGAFSLGAEFRVINNILYGQLNKIPAVLALMSRSNSYDNKWFSFPIETNITSELTAEQKDYVYQITRDAHLIKTIKKLSSETVGGESSYHFAFDLDREGISAYLQSLFEYVKTIKKDDSSLSTFDSTSIQKGLDSLKDFQGEIWIGRSDKLLHKLSINFGISPDLTRDEQIKINMVAVFSDYNKPVSITAPTDSTLFSDLMSNFLDARDLPPKLK